MRLSKKPEAKTAGQKRSEAWFVPRPERFWPTTQASGFAASRNRLGYWDRLLVFPLGAMCTAAACHPCAPGPSRHSPATPGSSKTEPVENAVSIYQDTAFNRSRCVTEKELCPFIKTYPLIAPAARETVSCGGKTYVYLSRHRLLSPKLRAGQAGDSIRRETAFGLHNLGSDGRFRGGNGEKVAVCAV